MNDFQPQTEQHLGISLEKIQHFLQIGRYDMAERELRQLLTHYPDAALLHVQLGWALRGLKQQGEAEEEARLALHLDPEEEEAMLLLAQLCLDAGRHQEAERLCLQALQIDPTSPRNFFVYGILMQKTSHLDKAEKLMRKCLELDPEYESAHSALSAILAEKRKSQSAIAHGQKGVGLVPDDNYSHATLGYAYLASGHPFKARSHLREAVRLAPDDSTLQEAFYEADRATRFIYLPMYFWSLLLERLPGQQFAVWIGFIILLQILRQSGAPNAITTGLAFIYLSFCIYTWVATPLANAWIKLRPAR